MNRRNLLVGLLIMTAPPALAQKQSEDYPANMRPTEVQKLLADKKIVLIDIRTPEEWKETGIAKDAVRIDMNDPRFGAKLNQAIEGDRTKPIALICRSSSRSRTVQQALLQSGYARVINVEGGMLGNELDKGWIKHDLPVTKVE
jgi:rhodanese-related sulfurtransferase